MLRGRKGEMGIGTLVLFIAMILVAAIAAGVLIQTATTLQSKALETGKRSTRQVSTALSTILLYGEDGTDGTVETVFQNVKLSPGSGAIKLNDSLISVDISNQSSELNYNSSANCSSLNSGSFAASYLKEGTEYKSGYVSIGDVVQFCYKLPSSISEDSALRVTFIPKVGSVMSVRVVTPPVMTTKRVFLYP